MMKKIIYIVIALCLLLIYANYNDNTLDKNAEVRKALEEYIQTDFQKDGDIYFLTITEMPKTFYHSSSYDSQYDDWCYFKVSFYYNDRDDGGFSGNYNWGAYVVKESSEAPWKVESLGCP